MASVNVKFRASVMESKEDSIFYSLVHKRKNKQISTPYKVFREEWSDGQGSIPPREEYLEFLQEHMDNDVRRLKLLLVSLDKGGDYTLDEVVDFYHSRYHPIF